MAVEIDCFPAPHTAERRRSAPRLGLVAVGGVLLASLALIAAAPARRAAPVPAPSNGRLLQVRLAEGPPPRLASAAASEPLDVRPTPVDAPLSPELASVQADAAFRAAQAADARQAAAFEAEQAREIALMNGEALRPTQPAELPPADPEPDLPAGAPSA